MQSVGPVPAHVELDVVFQWAEPWGTPTTDFALDVYDITGGTPVLRQELGREEHRRRAFPRRSCP